MKVRHKKHGTIGHSDKFNTSTLSEIIVVLDDGDASSEYSCDWEAWLEQSQRWVGIGDGLCSHDIVTNNYNTRFFEPLTQEDRERGYTEH